MIATQRELEIDQANREECEDSSTEQCSFCGESFNHGVMTACLYGQVACPWCSVEIEAECAPDPDLEVRA